MFEQRGRRRTPTSSRQRRTAAIVGDRQQPRLEFAGFVELRKIATGPRQRFLRRVFRVLPLPQKPQAKRQDAITVAGHQIAEGRLFALATTADDLR